MDFNENSLDNDNRHREIEECEKRKGKKNINHEGSRNKKTPMSCNYIPYDCYILLKIKYLFQEELHL